ALWPAALEAPDGIKRLAAIDYYERIALSRRSRAIRDFEPADLPPRGNEPSAPAGQGCENEANASARSVCENEANGPLAYGPVRLTPPSRHPLGAPPPPLWGRAGEGGGSCCARCAKRSPPPLTPPHKGEGNRAFVCGGCASIS